MVPMLRTMQSIPSAVASSIGLASHGGTEMAQRTGAHPAGDVLQPTKEGWGGDGQRRTRRKENALSAMDALTL